MPKKILIIAGDPSGDLHGANLIRHLLQISPQIELYALGGEKMRRESVNFLYNLVSLTVIGFFEVIKNFTVFWKIFKKVKIFLKKEKPDAVVLIDYPGFNLRVAILAKKLNIPVIYYISPQLWAWGRGRIKKIARIVTKILVVFPFEELMYQREKIDVSFVGHPLLDVMNPNKTKGEIWSLLGLEEQYPLIGLMPGSRKQELDYLLPVMFEVGFMISKDIPQAQFVLPLASNISESYINKFKIPDYKFQIIRDEDYNVRKTMDLALVASGTATLENACLGIPMIVMYKVSFLSYFLAKILVKVPYISLVNIIAEEPVVTEFIQSRIEARYISQIAVEWLKSPQKLSGIKNKLQKVKEKLGKSGASQKAAEEIVKVLK